MIIPTPDIIIISLLKYVSANLSLTVRFVVFVVLVMFVVFVVLVVFVVRDAFEVFVLLELLEDRFNFVSIITNLSSRSEYYV